MAPFQFHLATCTHLTWHLGGLIFFTERGGIPVSLSNFLPTLTLFRNKFCRLPALLCLLFEIVSIYLIFPVTESRCGKICTAFGCSPTGGWRPHSGGAGVHVFIIVPMDLTLISPVFATGLMFPALKRSEFHGLLFPTRLPHTRAPWVRR